MGAVGRMHGFRAVRSRLGGLMRFVTGETVLAMTGLLDGKSDWNGAAGWWEEVGFLFAVDDESQQCR